MTYGKHHLAIDKVTWQKGILSGKFSCAWENLAVEDIEPTWKNFEPLISRIETGVKWAELEAYQKEKMTPILAHPETRLILLKRNGNEVGYSLVVGANSNLKNRFWSSAQNRKLIEIENLALFKGERGNGTGKSFFEMIFKELFQNHDTIYWGTSDFNAETLVEFYKSKLGMRVLGYDSPEEARNRSKPPRRTGALVSQLT